MDRFKKNYSIFSVIVGLVAVIVFIIIFFINKSKDSGKKCFMDSEIVTDNYKLNFSSTTQEEVDGKVYYYVCFVITNTLDTDQTFTFSNPYFMKKKTKVTFKSLDGNGFTINPGKQDVYYLGCPVYAGDKIETFRLHFVLNGDKYNLYTKLGAKK